VDQALYRCRDILNSPFWNAQPQWLSEAVFTLLMIHLKDGLAALHTLDRRIAFHDDIPSGKDVTAHIIDVRNAICHVGSPSRVFGDGNSLDFGMVIGRGTLIRTPELEIGNPYEDDIAFFYGSLRVLLKRHIDRSIGEATQALIALSQENGWRRPWIAR